MPWFSVDLRQRSMHDYVGLVVASTFLQSQVGNHGGGLSRSVVCGRRDGRGLWMTRRDALTHGCHGVEAVTCSGRAIRHLSSGSCPRDVGAQARGVDFDRPCSRFRPGHDSCSGGTRGRAPAVARPRWSCAYGGGGVLHGHRNGPTSTSVSQRSLWQTSFRIFTAWAKGVMAVRSTVCAATSPCPLRRPHCPRPCAGI